MFFKPRQAVEAFSTDVTVVIIFNMSRRHVIPKPVLADELFVAHLARKIERSAFVFGHVLVVIGSFVEPFLALLAEKGEFARVDLHVPAEAG